MFYSNCRVNRSIRLHLSRSDSSRRSRHSGLHHLHRLLNHLLLLLLASLFPPFGRASVLNFEQLADGAGPEREQGSTTTSPIFPRQHAGAEHRLKPSLIFELKPYISFIDLLISPVILIGDFHPEFPDFLERMSKRRCILSSMNRTAKPLAVLLLFVLAIQSFAQIEAAGGGSAKVKEGLGRTWKGPGVSVISRILTRQSTATTRSTNAGNSRSGSGRPKAPPSAPVVSAPVMPPPRDPAATTSAVVFRPSGNSGVGEAILSVFAGSSSEKALLTEILKQVKQSYETEVRKDGKSNNVAAALTFFLASNVVVYHDLEMPSEDATEKMFVQLRDAMNTTPEIVKMTNAEKEQMHDWLVYMGGFVLLGYVKAKQDNDKKSLKDFREIAATSAKIVGVDISKITITANGLESAQLEKPTRYDEVIFAPALRRDRLA